MKISFLVPPFLPPNPSTEENQQLCPEDTWAALLKVPTLRKDPWGSRSLAPFLAAMLSQQLNHLPTHPKVPSSQNCERTWSF